MDLQGACNAILDCDELLEEDRIEQVQDIVVEYYRTTDLTAREIERKVLDILWKHRTGGPMPNIKSSLTPQANLQPHKTHLEPPPSDVSKLERIPAAIPAPISNACEPVDCLVDSTIAEDIGFTIDATTTSNTLEESEEPERDIDQPTPFDVLRKILGEQCTDKDIKKALEKNAYDIQRTLALLMRERRNRTSQVSTLAGPGDSFVVEIDSSVARSHTPVLVAEKEKIICKYFMSSGKCLRADCKYSHDISSRICRYWLQGSCLAGPTCPFLHEVPVETVGSSVAVKPPTLPSTSKLSPDEFPSLGESAGSKKKNRPRFSAKGTKMSMTPTPGAARTGLEAPFSADPPPIQLRQEQARSTNLHLSKVPLKALNRSRVKVVAPKLVPWVKQDFGVNAEYVHERSEAIKHADMRNKYLQLAANSWHKNDPAAAKLLSKKGQTHNQAMMDCYTKAADLLFDYRKHPRSEIYFDLHGMSLDESVETLEQILMQIEEEDRKVPRVVYVICGAGHYYVYSPEDKLSKRVKEYLDQWGYDWKEFRTSDNKFGKIIGVDPWSHV